jgi:hypothetical protein
MDARELRKRAEHYRRVALVVSDEDVSRALLDWLSVTRPWLGP